MQRSNKMSMCPWKCRGHWFFKLHLVPTRDLFQQLRSLLNAFKVLNCKGSMGWIWWGGDGKSEATFVDCFLQIKQIEFLFSTPGATSSVTCSLCIPGTYSPASGARCKRFKFCKWTVLNSKSAFESTIVEAESLPLMMMISAGLLLSLLLLMLLFCCSYCFVAFWTTSIMVL